MIEVPRGALRAGDLATHAEFFSFGTNDLTQVGAAGCWVPLLWRGFDLTASGGQGGWTPPAHLQQRWRCLCFCLLFCSRRAAQRLG